ncbi:MAG: oxidoreductase [Gammaproteobacteria bacterium]|jgi:ferredoxin--NADP+ reductase|nr:oxidoreductase [Gammaproteobacteria bacterium]
MSDIDFELGPICEATVKGNQRITPPASDEVRHLVLHVDDPAFRFLEGQTIGVVVPGPHAFGNRYHLRRYSVANARQSAAEDGVDVEILVRRCFYVDDVSGERYPGIASNYLCDAAPGQRITLSGPYRSPFRMPPGTSANLLMIGVGTGVAPFRGFIQHIYGQVGGWQGKVRLFYGARTGMELLYMNDQNADLANYYDERTFKAFQGVAPRAHLGAEAGLERSIDENAREVLELVEDPSTYVFVAGLERVEEALDKAMAKAAGSAERWQALKARLRDEDRWSELIYG